MCGFVFAPGFNLMGQAQQEKCYAAIEAISYRGIRTNIRVTKGGFFGHTRLPIVDPSDDTDHPRSYRGLYGMFVGEIFNFRDIDKNARVDLDAMLEAFSMEGFTAFHEFDGFWAGVIHYPTANSSWVFTDYLAQKPVFWRKDVDVYASEPVALLEFGPLPQDKLFVSSFLRFGYDPTGRTPWDGIEALPPGSFRKINANRTKPGHCGFYWDWDEVPKRPLRDAIVDATVRRVTGGAYPVAVLLSGGLDSTIVAKLAEAAKPNLRVFHVNNDEQEFADLVPLPSAQRTRVDLRKVLLDEALEANQSPVDLGSVQPQYALACSLEQAGYNVCLTGDGADELFGGYRRAREFDSFHHDVFLELPYYHNRRLDALMMRRTVELRTPFLSAPVVKGAMGLPRADRVDKFWLKEVFSDIVPDPILERTKKPLRADNYTHESVEHRKELLGRFNSIFSTTILR